MEKVRLGRTNLYVNQLGWGGIPIQRVNEQEAVSVIKAVIDMGVELLDTARGYTNSESRIGLALQTTDREVVLSSKSLVRTDRIGDEVRISLREMKVKKIHLYHLHNISRPEDYEKVMGPGGAYEGLMRMRDEGRVDFIGITSHSLDVLKRAVEDDHFDVIMACYSFLEPDADRKVFPLARAKDIGVISMKPFSGGVIEEPGPALRFVLTQPDIVPIPGSETLEKARANWEIFTQDHSLTRRDRSYIETLRGELDHQFCRRCDYCQPCPEKISIQHIMGLRYIVKRFGRSAEELDWFHSLIEKARNCTECGDCLKRCPYQLPIPEQIRKNLAWYDGLSTR
jgi:predicted aldo/keto reductase-like oxidoreductase